MKVVVLAMWFEGLKGSWEYSGSVKCYVCGREDEGIVLTRKLFWVFNVKMEVCEHCTSLMFRSFRKELKRK